MNKTDAVLVNRDQQQLRIIWLRGLLDLEERGAEGRPPVDDLQEGDLGVLGRHAGVLVVGGDDRSLPVRRALQLDEVSRDELAEHLAGICL